VHFIVHKFDLNSQILQTVAVVAQSVRSAGALAEQIYGAGEWDWVAFAGWIREDGRYEYDRKTVPRF
jgi:hypothetical protein